MRSAKPTRESIVEQLKGRLSMARFQISVILLMTAAAAFAVSVVLLNFGVTSMALRYPVAIIAGYFVFLILLRIWIWLQSEDSSLTNAADADIIAVVGDIGLPDAGSAAKDFSFGGGGDFGGGGAGGSWADADASVPMPAAFVSSGSTSSSGGGSSLFGDVDLDDGVALVVVLIVVALVFSSLIYVVWIAPVLFAELLVDAAVAGSLYKPIKNIDRRYWLTTALRKTGVPAIIVVLLVTVAGAVMQSADPDAVTLGQFIRSL